VKGESERDASRRLLDVSLAEPLPRFIAPMLLTPGEPPEGDDWTYEVKWDGMRAQVRWDGGTVSALACRGGSATNFPSWTGLRMASAAIGPPSTAS
jgi:bifunctional non-homologous end joining protein LigD